MGYEVVRIRKRQSIELSTPFDHHSYDHAVGLLEYYAFRFTFAEVYAEDCDLYNYFNEFHRNNLTFHEDFTAGLIWVYTSAR